MYTVRYYKQENNNWQYLYSKPCDLLGEVGTNIPPGYQARIYDEFNEPLKVITGGDYEHQSVK